MSRAALRGFGDGFAIIMLPAYLSAIGYAPVEIGIVAPPRCSATAADRRSASACLRAAYPLRNLLLARRRS